MPDSTDNTQKTTPTPSDKTKATGYEAPVETPATNTAPTEETGSKFDDNGYAIVEETKEEIPPVETPATEEEVTDPVTGYGEEPPVVEDAPPAKEEETPEPVEGYKIEDAGDLVAEEVTELTKFINDNKVPKEIADALVAQKKIEVKKLVDLAAEQEKETQRVKASWHQELKSDKDFGGENFSKSVNQAEKVLNDFFPGMKKRLTESGGMLPPYVMKDLAKLAGHLYSSEKLVTGDPTKSTPPDQERDDTLDFYNS